MSGKGATKYPPFTWALPLLKWRRKALKRTGATSTAKPKSVTTKCGSYGRGLKIQRLAVFRTHSGRAEHD